MPSPSPGLYPEKSLNCRPPSWPRRLSGCGVPFCSLWASGHSPSIWTLPTGHPESLSYGMSPVVHWFLVVSLILPSAPHVLSSRVSHMLGSWPLVGVGLPTRPSCHLGSVACSDMPIKVVSAYPLTLKTCVGFLIKASWNVWALLPPAPRPRSSDAPTMPWGAPRLATVTACTAS